MPPKASTKRKAANGYRLPDPIPDGEILNDGKKQWRIGKSIGVGGFGEIYLCSDDINNKVNEADATHVMKVEPSENGPLFVEMHFYIRAATIDTIESFRKEKGIKKDIGIPCFRGKGLHSYKNQDYRFLVIDRFGKDLQKIFQSGKKLFAPKAAFNLAIRIIDSLEYIHSQGYVHNDIKAQNLLLGHGRKKENDVYLVDFGLVSKYKINGVHMEYKPDVRKAHDGTIEYTSRDAHIGAHSRRSDLEILGYNLVHWMSGNLPWMSNLTNPVTVHNMKKNHMNDVVNFLQNCFGEENEYPSALEEFLNYVVGLEYDTKPDYDRCREIFISALKKLRLPSDGKVDFSATKSPLKKKRKRKVSSNVDVEVEFHCRKSARTNNSNHKSSTHPTPAASPSPLTPMDPNSQLSSNLTTTDYGAHTRSAAPNNPNEEWCWESILCSDPEMLIRQASRNSEADDENPLAIQRRAVEAEKHKESLVNPTPAMIKILKKIEEREIERQNLSWSQQLHHLTNNKKNMKNNTWADLTPNPLTPAMEEVIEMRSKRVSIEVDIPITPDPSDEEEEDYEDESDSSHEEYRPNNPRKKKKSGKKIKNSIKNQLSSDGSPCSPNPPKFNQSLQLQLTPLDPSIKTVKVKSSRLKTYAKRRISIQNEAELIRNKTSPPSTLTSSETQNKKQRSIKLKEKFILSSNSNEMIDQFTPPSTRSSSRRNSRKSSPVLDNASLTDQSQDQNDHRKNSFEVPVKPLTSRKRRRQSNNSEDSSSSSRGTKQNSIGIPPPPKRKADVLDPVPELAAMSPLKKRRYNLHKVLPPSPSTEKWQKSLRVNPERMLKQKHIMDAAIAAAASSSEEDDEDNCIANY